MTEALWQPAQDFWMTGLTSVSKPAGVAGPARRGLAINHTIVAGRMLRCMRFLRGECSIPQVTICPTFIDVELILQFWGWEWGGKIDLAADLLRSSWMTWRNSEKMDGLGRLKAGCGQDCPPHSARCRNLAALRGSGQSFNCSRTCVGGAG